MLPVVVIAGSREKARPALAAFAAVGIAEERMLVITPGDAVAADRGELAAIVAGAAGVALLGGGDPHSSNWGEEPLAEVPFDLEPGRDELERAVIEAARERRVPTWGICRGMQMINVVLGGSLWQDIPTQLAGALGHDRPQPHDALVHTIEVVAPETALGALLASETCLVNSRHHQAIRDVAAGLRVVGLAPDGVVEAYVGRDAAWWLEGVQWHPENLLPMTQQRAILERFAAAVAAHEDP